MSRLSLGARSATRGGSCARSARRSLALAQALVRVDTVAIPPDGHETAAQKVLRGLR